MTKPQLQKRPFAPKQVAAPSTTENSNIVTRLVLKASVVHFSDEVLEEIGERAAGLVAAQAAVVLGSVEDELYHIKDRAADFVHNTRFERLFKEVLRVFRGAPPALNERARSIQIASRTQGPVTKVLIGQAVTVVFTELNGSESDMRALFCWLANELTTTSGVLDRQADGRTFRAAHQFVGEKVFDLVALLLVALLYRDDDVDVLKDKAKFLCSDTLLSEVIPDSHDLVAGVKSSYTKIKHAKVAVGKRFGEHGLQGDRGVYNLLSLLLSDAAGTLHRFRLSKSQNTVDYTKQLAPPSQSSSSDYEDGSSVSRDDVREEQNTTLTGTDTSRTTRTRQTLQDLSDTAFYDSGADDEEEENAEEQDEAVVGDEDSSPPRPLSNRRRMPRDRATASRRQWKPLLSSPDASTSGPVNDGGSPTCSGGGDNEDDRFSDIYLMDAPGDGVQDAGGEALSNSAQADDSVVDGIARMDNTTTARQDVQNPAEFIARPASATDTARPSPARARHSSATSPTNLSADGMQPAQYIAHTPSTMHFGTASGPLAFPTSGEAQASPVSASQSPIRASSDRHRERADVENIPATALTPATTPRPSLRGALSASPVTATRSGWLAPPRPVTPRSFRSRFPVGPLRTCVAPCASPAARVSGFGAPPSARDALAESTSAAVNTPGALFQAGSSRALRAASGARSDVLVADAARLDFSMLHRNSGEEDTFAGTSPLASAANPLRDEHLPPKVMQAPRHVHDPERTEPSTSHDAGDAPPVEAPADIALEQIHGGARPAPDDNGALTHQAGAPLGSRPQALLPSALSKAFGPDSEVVRGGMSAGLGRVPTSPSPRSSPRGLRIINVEIKVPYAIAQPTLPLRVMHTSQASRPVATAGRFLLSAEHTSEPAHVLAVATESAKMASDAESVPTASDGSEVDEEGYAGDYEGGGGRYEGRRISGPPRKRFKLLQAPLTMDEPSVLHVHAWSDGRGSSTGGSDRSRYAPSPETPTRLPRVVLATPPSECGPLPTRWPDFSDPYVPPPLPARKTKEMFVD